MKERRYPTAAENITTIQGGHFQTVNNPKAAKARQKSNGLLIAFIHTGLYNAASKIPTTAALIP